VLLEHVADLAVAEGRRVHVPLHGVARGPVPIGLGADVERHLDALARVLARAARAGQVPVRPDVARAPFRLGLGAPARADDRARRRVEEALGSADDASGDAALRIGEEPPGALAVPALDPGLLRPPHRHVDETSAAAHRLDVQAAPEVVLALDLVGL